MSRRKNHCCCNNCCCQQNNCCGGLGSFPTLLYGLGLGNSPFNSCSNDNSLIMLLLLSSLMKRR